MPSEREEGEEFERPSKTQVKKEMLELQALGEALVALADEQLSALPVPENLHDAIREYRRTPTHGGRRRQMQYIGKLMRGVDAEPIRAAVEAMRRGHDAESRALHEAERWRAMFVESDEALSAWVAEHPAADLQKLRRLIRAARTTAAEQPNRRALRELFRFIKAQLSAGA
jgi:ribosome-associated protein